MRADFQPGMEPTGNRPLLYYVGQYLINNSLMKYKVFYLLVYRANHRRKNNDCF